MKLAVGPISLTPPSCIVYKGPHRPVSPILLIKLSPLLSYITLKISCEFIEICKKGFFIANIIVQIFE